MFVKDSDCEPGGGIVTTNVALFSHLELVDRNLMAALMSQHAGKAGGRGGGRSSGTGNTLPTFFMSNTSLCVTCHLRDTLTSSPLPASHTQTPFQKCKQAPVRTLTECLCCMPLGQKSCRTQPVPIWKLLVPRPV